MKSEAAKIIEIVGEKWVAEFDIDGVKNMAMTNHHRHLPKFVMQIRQMGGRNIVIRDGTIMFCDEDNDE